MPDSEIISCKTRRPMAGQLLGRLVAFRALWEESDRKIFDLQPEIDSDRHGGTFFWLRRL